MDELRIHHLTFSADSMSVNFSDERSVAVPLSSFPRLHATLPSEREQWQLIGRGLGVHWESLLEDLCVENVLLAYSRSKTSEYAHASHA